MYVNTKVYSYTAITSQDNVALTIIEIVCLILGATTFWTLPDMSCRRFKPRHAHSGMMLRAGFLSFSLYTKPS